jgi:hypothetical protein
MIGQLQVSHSFNEALEYTPRKKERQGSCRGFLRTGFMYLFQKSFTMAPIRIFLYEGVNPVARIKPILQQAFAEKPRSKKAFWKILGLYVLL